MPTLSCRAATVFTLSAVMACSSSSGGSSGPLDITGTWRLCDVAAESGMSDYPGGGTYIEQGGILLELTEQQGLATASEMSGDGGVVQQSIGWIDDAGDFCDGGSCGETSVLLSGPFDPVSRVWSAGFLWPHGEGTGGTIETYPARLTFSVDGARFTGIMDDGSGPANWFGGREDGSFACASGAGGSAGEGGSLGSCGGTPNCGSAPCADGCLLNVASDPVYDTCSPEADYCQGWGDQQSCQQANGCSWNQ
jgi:hypothetical protein